MARQKTLLALLLLANAVLAQVTTTPAFISKGYTGQVVVTFDPTQGNAGMATATSCYAHTGIITDASSGESDWKYVTDTWRGGATKNKMTKVGNVWQLTMSSLEGFYGCPSGTDIQKLAFVFNDGPSGTKEGKTADGKDIFITLYEAGLNAKFDAPTDDQLVATGTSITFNASASASGQIELKINNETKKTTTGTTLSYTQTFSTTGDYQCVLVATVGGQTASDTIHICVAGTSPTQARPAGIDEGVYYNSSDATQATLSMYAASKTAPAQNVFVVGDFNGWKISSEYQLKRDGNFFWITLTGLTPQKEYAYQYVVTRADGVVKRISDAYAPKVLHPDDKYEPTTVDPNIMPYPEGKGDGYVSVLQTAKPAFAWSSNTLNFVRPDKNNLVIYEMWVYDFSPLRSIKAATKRLDYLQSLGVNAIELMPICEYDGNYSWGYNPTHYFAPDRALGSEEDYKTFIDECHKRGIAVILDMVFNHATGGNPQNKLYPYGTDLAQNPWFNVTAPHTASVFEDWNHDFAETQKMFRNVLKFWLNEYKVDGYRMDLSHGFCGPTCTNRMSIITDYYNNGVKAADPNAYFIMEHWEYSERASLVSQGMLCWENNTNAHCQTAMGWLRDGDALANSSKDGYVSYCESHDEERCFYKAKRWGNGSVATSQADRMNRVPLNIAFNVLLNGPHMLWQFEELGYDYAINSNESGTDQPDGDTSYRTSIKPQPEVLGWYTDALRMTQYQKVAQIIALRTQLAPAIFAGNPTSTDIGSGKSVRSIVWGSGHDAIIAVGNLNVAGGTQYTGAQTYALPAGNWYSYLDNATTAQAGGSSITLQPGELKIFTAKRFVLPTVPSTFHYDDYTSVPNVSAQRTCDIFPTLATDKIWIASEELPQRIQVYSLRGTLVAETRHTTEVDVNALSNGMYLMVITFGKTQEAFKFIKQ